MCIIIHISIEHEPIVHKVISNMNGIHWAI